MRYWNFTVYLLYIIINIIVIIKISNSMFILMRILITIVTKTNSDYEP